MNWNRINKRQIGYAKRLYALKKIGRPLYGLMLTGWADYIPCFGEVRVYAKTGLITEEHYVGALK